MDGENKTPGALPLPRIFRALRHRNFRLFIMGQGLSLIGTWMQMTAVMWLVWRLGHSAALLGIVGFAGRIPSVVVSPFAGVIVDRMDRYRLVLLSQILSMVQALLLAGLMYSGHIAIWHIIVLSIFLGFINALDIPARQSFLIQMLDEREDLTNAIALNSSLFNATRLVGPAVAGFLIAATGEAFCFLVNGLSYVAVIGGLLMMRVPKKEGQPNKEPILKNLGDGFRYAFGSPPIRALLILLAMVSLVGASHVQLIPIFAEEILHGDARTQGFLLSASGLGSLFAALYLANRRSVAGLAKIIAWSPILFGVALMVMGVSTRLWLTLAIMPVTGLGLMLQMASTNTVLQTIVEDDKRGRVMSLYAMAFMGMVPIGSLLAGGLAQQIGAPRTIILCGLFCIIGGIAFLRGLPAFRAHLRPIYLRQGILGDKK